LGEGSLKEEGSQEENEEIQRGDQGPLHPAYDEAKHSSDVENGRASRWWRAPDSK